LRAMPLWNAGDTAAAAELAGSALSLVRMMHVEGAQLDATDALCGILVASGELARAIEVGEQGLAKSKDRGELWVRGYLLNFLAQANWLRGDQEGGEALAREAVTCKHALDDRFGLTVALETLAWMAAELGRHQRAPASWDRPGGSVMKSPSPRWNYSGPSMSGRCRSPSGGSARRRLMPRSPGAGR
jgi:ATP/maltotriose-dependent transcriptional regulator MalT